MLGRYRLLDEIGAGGFSRVWRAEQEATGRIVALKLPRVPEFIAHLQRESLIAARFQDPQVVPIEEVHLGHHPPFLVMPYVAGNDLPWPVPAPPPEQILHAFVIFRWIAEIVARLHDADVVHGDLKPGNIRFDEASQCRLLDLGLARHQVATRQTTTLRASIVGADGRNIAGTLDFMAPEVMEGKPPEKAADVYALGVILHGLLCGRPPAFGVSPRELNAFLPEGTSAFLRQMLHPDPAMRPPDADALLPEIAAFIRSEERCLKRPNGHARRLVFTGRMRTLVRGFRALTILAALGMALVLGANVLTRFRATAATVEAGVAVAMAFGFPLMFMALLLGITTINAWAWGVPEKTYKNRRGHPWWTFMMQ